MRLDRITYKEKGFPLCLVLYDDKVCVSVLNFKLKRNCFLLDFLYCYFRVSRRLILSLPKKKTCVPNSIEFQISSLLTCRNIRCFLRKILFGKNWPHVGKFVMFSFLFAVFFEGKPPMRRPRKWKLRTKLWNHQVYLPLLVKLPEPGGFLVTAHLYGFNQRNANHVLSLDVDWGKKNVLFCWMQGLAETSGFNEWLEMSLYSIEDGKAVIF